jgi:transcriptional regulator with XRE-family HTH domain
MSEPWAEIRDLSGVTLQRSAKEIGVAVSTIAAVERGRTKLTPAQSEKLLAFYKAEIRTRLRRIDRLVPLFQKNEAVTRAGAPGDGFKGRSGDDAPNHAG